MLRKPRIHNPGGTVKGEVFPDNAYGHRYLEFHIYIIKPSGQDVGGPSGHCISLVLQARHSKKYSSLPSPEDNSVVSTECSEMLQDGSLALLILPLSTEVPLSTERSVWGSFVILEHRVIPEEK